MATRFYWSDEILGPEACAATQDGDVWILGTHCIIRGDSTDKPPWRALLWKDKPHLMVTDPPYGVEYHPRWRAKAGVNKNQPKMVRFGKTTGTTGVRPWHRSRAAGLPDILYQTQ